MRSTLAAIIASIGLLALGGPVSAEPAPGGGEYTTAVVGENQYVVVFRGAPRMSRRDVAAAALRQAAQTAVDHDQEWFFVRQSQTERIDASAVAGLDDINRTGGTVRDTSAGAGGGQSGPRSSGTTATAGVDPGAVGVGTQAPNELLDRRRPPRRVYQTTLIVQIGSGDEVAIQGLTEAPEIFDAAALLAED